MLANFTEKDSFCHLKLQGGIARCLLLGLILPKGKEPFNPISLLGLQTAWQCSPASTCVSGAAFAVKSPSCCLQLISRLPASSLQANGPLLPGHILAAIFQRCQAQKQNQPVKSTWLFHSSRGNVFLHVWTTENITRAEGDVRDICYQTQIQDEAGRGLSLWPLQQPSMSLWNSSTDFPWPGITICCWAGNTFNT